MKIQIVKNVDIQPKYKSIYLTNKGNYFEFTVYHGSGHFSVSINDTGIADVQHRDRVVRVNAISEGAIEIKVEDIEIPDSEIARAELLISDIFRLDLDAPGSLIEQGLSMNLSVTAFDSANNEFDFDQYRLMEFFTEVEGTGTKRDRDLYIESSKENNTIFEAFGRILRGL